MNFARLPRRSRIGRLVRLLLRAISLLPVRRVFRRPRRSRSLGVIAASSIMNGVMAAKWIYRSLEDYRKGAAVRSFLRGGMIPWTDGYGEYKAQMIQQNLGDVTVLDSFRRGRLPAGYGYHLDERIVEYPWFFSHLDNRSEAVLDAGSTLNIDYLLNTPQLAQKRVTIVTLDKEGFARTPRTISYVYDDLRALPFKDELFDVTVCLSTLEHVGLDNTRFTHDPSKRENAPDSYLQAVSELVRVTKRTGASSLRCRTENTSTGAGSRFSTPRWWRGSTSALPH